MNINKKFIVDEKGNPTEVIILFKDYKRIEQMLGLDLDDAAIKELKKAQKDRKSKKPGIYKDLASI